MDPLEELLDLKRKAKREKRDMLCFIAGFIVAFAMVGLAYVGRI